MFGKCLNKILEGLNKKEIPTDGEMIVLNGKSFSILEGAWYLTENQVIRDRIFGLLSA